VPIIISMRRQGPAVVRISAVGGHSARLSWLSGIVVPPDVEIEFVDFEFRAEVVVTRRDEQVTVISDLATGERIMQTNGNSESPLASLALACIAARESDGPTGERHAPARSLTLSAIAELGGAEHIRPATVRYPLPEELDAGSDMPGGASVRAEADE
jgi:hypothetical protein